MATENDLYSILGLCQKAGKLVSGGDLVEDAIRSRKARLVILSEDIGESMLKRFTDKTAFYSVDLIRFGTKDLIGSNIGKGPRSAVAITDKGFAGSFIKKYQTIHPGVNYIG